LVAKIVICFQKCVYLWTVGRHFSLRCWV
jgi:hypothetical protein